MTATLAISTAGGRAVAAGSRRTRGPILLAVDGTESGVAAFTAAHLLASRTGVDVHVLSVLEPMPAIVPALEAIALPQGWDTSRAEDLLGRVRQQVRASDGSQSNWSTEVRLGNPALLVARTARDLGASLVITGLSRHSVLDRLLGGETPLHIAELADVPVLAVATTMETLPSRLLVAVDLGPGSAGIARTALDLFPDALSVNLVHVKPRLDALAARAATWIRRYEESVAAGLADIRTQLPAPAHVETVTPSGNVAREILDFAAYARADLIVAGSPRRGLRQRLLGNVAARLLRGATGAVLLVPAATAGHGESRTLTLTEPDAWAAALRELSRRNAGRRVVLEIHDDALGAQAQVVDYPLLGADFDQPGQRVEIMLGDTTPGGRHLTHRVIGPTSVDVLRAADGSDSALRVAYAGGQAVMSFSP